MGVWIETILPKEVFKQKVSHPAWVCGLKPANLTNDGIPEDGSHPAWVCGLKHSEYIQIGKVSSHTLRGCVD